MKVVISKKGAALLADKSAGKKVVTAILNHKGDGDIRVNINGKVRKFRQVGTTTV